MSGRNELQPKQFGAGRAYLRRVVAASMAGTVVEWYEFFLYGAAATRVFSEVFFAKGGNDLDAIFAAVVTYDVGFAARPIGGVVFGQLGDRYGRKKLLQLSLLLVGAAGTCWPQWCCWFSRRRCRMRRSSAGAGASPSGCPRSSF